ncbi:carboxymuconolactone decarboxylase family protein [Rhodoplanes sp. TEM]|uniref:Carboxymuconolactone decarboxylase family protein n=1 Tax=Rhodoplanes tepidamans TaxID=200616 RepID=A0ABT5J7B1_RHOTP|nr:MULTISPECIES: carboxymuconolactone decarboxylase family protein [Rhodoplanes]MDC7784910.1 carboxymuconolactone decarboxylase family protein [Rhodoplanes tepidamans]MDC7983994.1 carboxymuconolactone decarboxylase family protein [Rhodoplanes sp. TEM]MDQ0353861.1 AhpD family alkylhydroperoxidase [Rhodoplanes tepidamans]
MTERVTNWLGRRNDGVAAMAGVETWVGRQLDHTLLELIKTRVSQINGCAFCLHMHSADALKAGESVARLLLLDAWEESALYTPRERAALAWAEALTRVADTHAPDAAWEEVRAHFSEDEVIALSIAVGMINAWNRLAIGFRVQHPADRAAAAAA